jgi:dTDP-4-dehydrorhamnose reductase
LGVRCDKNDALPQSPAKLTLAEVALTIAFSRVNESLKKMVWVTGANGLIGSYLLETAPQFAPHCRVRGLTRADFDLLDSAAVERAFVSDAPQMIIHCAAITVVSVAQKNPVLAHRVNVELTQFLAGLAADISFVFFSTDLVFDGRQGNYVETDAANPLHVYGETKLAAETAVLKHPRHLVVRTSLNGGVSRGGTPPFNEQLRRSLQQPGQGMTLFRDEFRCPIPAAETARAVWELAAKHCSGLYHVAGAEKLSRLQIGELLVKRWPEVTATITSGLARDFAGPPRALDTSLNIAKTQKVLASPLPGLGAWLAAHPHANF